MSNRLDNNLDEEQSCQYITIMLNPFKNRILILVYLVILSHAVLCKAETYLTVIFTGNTNGVLESCRCPGNLFGGLVHRKTVIDSLRLVYPDAVVVDAGDFLPVDPDTLKSEFVIQAMKLCGYNAIALGDQDLCMSIDFIRRQNLPLLCTNRETERITFETSIPPSVPLIRNGKKVLITGFFGPTLRDLIQGDCRLGNGFMDPIETWRYVIEPVRSSYDFVIVLSHQGYDSDLAMLDEIDEIDFLVSGHSQVLLEKPEKYGNTWIAAAGKNAEYVGLAKFRISDEGFTLSEYRMIPLVADNVGESVEIVELVTEYNLLHRKRLRKRALAAGRRYYGNDVCIKCHETEYSSWKSTPHSNALQTLINAGKEKTASCLECHTTGFGFPGGYDESDSLSAQAGVGCEECHIVVTGQEGFSGGLHKSLAVSQQQCLHCHIKPHILHFDFKNMREKVKHGTQD